MPNCVLGHVDPARLNLPPSLITGCLGSYFLAVPRIGRSLRHTVHLPLALYPWLYQHLRAFLIVYDYTPLVHLGLANSTMHVNFAFLAALSLSLSQRAIGKTFYLKDQWRGNDFFQGWNWETENDPSHGRVNYVSQGEARSKHLAYGTILLPSHPFFARILSHYMDFSGWR